MTHIRCNKNEPSAPERNNHAESNNDDLLPRDWTLKEIVRQVRGRHRERLEWAHGHPVAEEESFKRMV